MPWGSIRDVQPDDAEEITRQADLGRLRSLASEYREAAGTADVEGYLAELARRFSTQQSGRGVNLLTFHRAKGLEFDAVFLPRLLDKELPFRTQRSSADPEEERRLLYVGITRAREHLYLSWPREPRTSPSPFLTEIGVLGVQPAVHASRGEVARPRPCRLRRRSALRPPEGMAQEARLGGRRARLRGVPRHDARRDRGAEAA